MTEPLATAAEDVRLPDNAFRPLTPGETYAPIVPAAAVVPEVTVRSVVQGALWAVVFSAAATYIALKLGQGIESAIPISILAVGFSVLRDGIPEEARVDAARERQRARDRRDLGHRRRRLRLHDAGDLHPRPREPLVVLADLPRPAPRRGARRLLPRAVPPLLRARPARAGFPTPRRGPRPRSWSPDARRPRRSRPDLVGARRRRLRLRRAVDEGLGRELLLGRHHRARRVHRAHEGGLHDEHVGGGVRPRLHHGPRLRGDHHGRLDGVVLRARAALRVVRAARRRRHPAGDRRRSPRCPRRRSSPSTCGRSASAGSSPPASSRS